MGIYKGSTYRAISYVVCIFTFLNFVPGGELVVEYSTSAVYYSSSYNQNCQSTSILWHEACIERFVHLTFIWTLQVHHTAKIGAPQALLA